MKPLCETLYKSCRVSNLKESSRKLGTSHNFACYPHLGDNTLMSVLRSQDASVWGTLRHFWMVSFGAMEGGQQEASHFNAYDAKVKTRVF